MEQMKSWHITPEMCQEQKYYKPRDAKYFHKYQTEIHMKIFKRNLICIQEFKKIWQEFISINGAIS